MPGLLWAGFTFYGWFVWTRLAWPWRALGAWPSILHAFTPPWPFVLDSAVRTARGAVVAALVAAAVQGAGRAVRQWLRLAGSGPDRMAQNWLYAAAIGIAAVGLPLQGFGLTGLADFRILAPLLVLAAASSWATGAGRGGRDALAAGFAGDPGRQRPPLALRAAGGAAVIAVLIAACAPEASRDAVVYHLRAPVRYLLQHRIIPLDDVPHAAIPDAGEMLFMLGSAAIPPKGGMAGHFNGEVAARLIHALAWLTCGLGAALVARKAAGPGAGPWAAALWLTLPLAAVVGSRANVEAFVVLPVLALVLHLSGRGRRSAVAAGALAGAAFCAKYQGGVAVAAAGFLYLRRGRPRAIAAYGATTLALMTPWLVRNALWTGAPLFPATASALHWTPVDSAGLAADGWATPLLRGGLPPLPGLLLGSHSPEGGFTAPLLTAAIIPLLAVGVPGMGLWRWAAGLAGIGLMLSGVLRFLLPAAAVACAAAGAALVGPSPALDAAGRRWHRGIAIGGMLIGAVLSAGAIEDATAPYAAVTGNVSRARYGPKEFPGDGYAEIIRGLHACVSRTDRVYLLGQVYAWGLERRTWTDYYYLRPPLYWWLLDAPSADRIRIRARQANLTWIAWNPVGAASIAAAHPGLTAWTDAQRSAWRDFSRRFARPRWHVGGWQIFELAAVPEPRSGRSGLEEVIAAGAGPAAPPGR